MILSNYYDLPFNDILDWHKFAVVLKEHDVYRLKQILKDIADTEFVALHKNLVKVEYDFLSQFENSKVVYLIYITSHFHIIDLLLRFILFFLASA